MDPTTIVIHGCSLGSGIEVLTINESVTFYPPPRMGQDMQDAFAKFGIEWHEGVSTRENFLVKIDKHLGVKHFDLVFESSDPETSRVGLRPWSNNEPNPGARVLWAQQNIEPRDWLH